MDRIQPYLSHALKLILTPNAILEIEWFKNLCLHLGLIIISLES